MKKKKLVSCKDEDPKFDFFFFFFAFLALEYESKLLFIFQMWNKQNIILLSSFPPSIMATS